MEFLRKPVFYIALVIVILVIVVSTYTSNKKKSAQTTTTQTTSSIANLTNLDPTNYDDQVKTEFALANAKAAAANPAFKISVIEVNMDKDLSLDTVSTRYIYSADSDTANNWMITISAKSQSFIRALIPKDDYAGKVTPFDPTAWKYNFVTALQLAEKAGGLDWRGQNTLVGVKMTLKNSGTDNKLTWIIEYTGSAETKTINLDAATGATITE